MKSLQALLLRGERHLSDNGIQDAKFDAWLLFEHVFGITKSQFLLIRQQEADSGLSGEYMRLILIRAAHKPVQYIIGVQEFMGLEFTVDESVLIPRQDTELLVERAILQARELETKELCVLDMCTGSGCIAISLAKHTTPKRTVGADISEKALSIARKNAVKNNVNVEFVHSDLFDNIEGKFQIITANPPYIRTRDIDGLMVEVRDYEPLPALDGGEDGLDFYRGIAAGAKDYLARNGLLLVEIGFDEALQITEILKNNGYTNIKCFKDLAGLDRVLSSEFIG